MDEPELESEPPAIASVLPSAVVLDASDADPRTRTGRERLGPPHPVLPVLGAAVLPDGHHLTVAYGAPAPDDPASGLDPTGTAPTEIEARVFVQARHGRWLMTGAGRYRRTDGTVIHGRGAASSTRARAWCWLHPRAVAAVHLHTNLEPDDAGALSTPRVLGAALLVDDPTRDARLFLHVIDDPAIHVLEARALDEHGDVVSTIDWRAHDTDWHHARAQLDTALPTGAPLT